MTRNSDMNIQEYTHLLIIGIDDGCSCNLKVCVSCNATYEPYKVGKESELFGFLGHIQFLVLKE